MLYSFTSLRRTTEPAALAVLLTTAKAHLRVSHSSEDTILGVYLGAAIRYVEEITGRALITQSWTLTLPGFSDLIVLPRPPFTSLTTFTYLDEDSVSRTVSSSLYTSDTASDPGAIRRKPGSSWPTTDCTASCVTAVYAAGYGASETSVPDPIKQAILLLVGHFYENREAVSVGGSTPTEYPLAVDALLMPYRLLQV